MYTISVSSRVVAVTQQSAGGTPLDDLELLEADTLDRIRSLTRVASGVTAIIFDGRGDRIATVSGDGTVDLWDVTTGDHLFTPPAEVSAVREVAFNEDGSRLVVVYEDGRIISHPIELEDAIEIARSRVGRPLTDAECQRYLHVASCPTD
jgi:hypothetical protein